MMVYVHTRTIGYGFETSYICVTLRTPTGLHYGREHRQAGGYCDPIWTHSQPKWDETQPLAHRLRRGTSQGTGCQPTL